MVFSLWRHLSHGQDATVLLSSGGSTPHAHACAQQGFCDRSWGEMGRGNGEGQEKMGRGKGQMEKADEEGGRSLATFLSLLKSWREKGRCKGGDWEGGRRWGSGRWVG